MRSGVVVKLGDRNMNTEQFVSEAEDILYQTDDCVITRYNKYEYYFYTTLGYNEVVPIDVASFITLIEF
jgi:hypothetical protein